MTFQVRAPWGCRSALCGLRLASAVLTLSSCGRIGVEELLHAEDGVPVAVDARVGDRARDAAAGSDMGVDGGNASDAGAANDAELEPAPPDAMPPFDAAAGPPFDAARPTDGAVEQPLDAARADAARESPPADAAQARDATAAAPEGGVPACSFDLFAAPEEVLGLQTAGATWAPVLSADGTTLYFAETVGSDQRIMAATRVGRGLTFQRAQELLNVQSAEYDGTPFVSADGLTLFMYSMRSGGRGDRDVWIATRVSPSDLFGVPVVLESVNSPLTDQFPRLSSDGLTLTLSSTRTGGLGQSDLWYAQRANVRAAFAAPANWSELNSTSSDDAASLSSDGLTVFFASTRAGGVGERDIWTATRTSPQARFAAPTNLTNVNSTSSDGECAISGDGLELFFSSDRDGTRKIWRSTRGCR